MHFGENQLSRSLIGLSPLPTTHPLSLQPKWVRASTRSYPRFTLAMGRSLRFGSRTRHYTTHYCVDTPYSDSLSLRLPLNGLTSRHVPDSQAHSSKGTPSPHDKSRALTDCRHTVSGTISLPSRGTFHHSLTVLSAIGHWEVFRLTGWSRQIHSRFHGPAATRGTCHNRERVFTYRALTVYGRPSQATSINTNFSDCRPGRQTREDTPHNTAHTTPAGYHMHTV